MSKERHDEDSVTLGRRDLVSVSRHLHFVLNFIPSCSPKRAKKSGEVCRHASSPVCGLWVSQATRRRQSQTRRSGLPPTGLVYRTHSTIAVYPELSVPNLCFFPNSTRHTVQKQVSLKETSGHFVDLLNTCIVLGKLLSFRVQEIKSVPLKSLLNAHIKEYFTSTHIFKSLQVISKHTSFLKHPIPKTLLPLWGTLILVMTDKSLTPQTELTVYFNKQKDQAQTLWQRVQNLISGIRPREILQPT